MSNEFKLATAAITEALTDSIVRNSDLARRSGVVFAYARFEQAEENQGFDPRLAHETGHFIPDFFLIGTYTFEVPGSKNPSKYPAIAISAARFAVAHAHQSTIAHLRRAEILAAAVQHYPATCTNNTVTVRAKLRVARGDSAAVYTPRRAFIDVARDALSATCESHSSTIESIRLERDIDSTGAGMLTLYVQTRKAHDDWGLSCQARNISTTFCTVFEEEQVSDGFQISSNHNVEHTVMGERNFAITIPFTAKV